MFDTDDLTEQHDLGRMRLSIDEAGTRVRVLPLRRSQDLP